MGEISKEEIKNLEAKYRKVTGYPEPTIVNQETIPVIEQPYIPPQTQVPVKQEIRANESEPFLPADLPPRKLDKIIEDYYEKEKQEHIDLAYKRLTNLLFTGNIGQNALPQTQTAVQPIYVKDNSEAIREIDAAILDPDSKDLQTLQNLKRKLQGKPIETQRPYVPPQSTPKAFTPAPTSTINPQVKQPKNYSVKFGLAMFGLTCVITAAIIYTILVFAH